MSTNRLSAVVLVILASGAPLVASGPPAQPAIQVAAEDIGPGVHGLLAAVAPQAGSSYSWTAQGGSIDSGQGTNQITFGAGVGTTVTLTCTVTNQVGAASASLVLPIPTGGLTPLPATAVGGLVQGLSAGVLVLQNNAGNNLRISASGAFTFGVPVAAGAPYSVAVLSQPGGQVCSVVKGTGVVGPQGVNDVMVTCVTQVSYPLLPPGSLGGRITGSVRFSFTSGLATEGLFAIRNAIVADLDGDGYPDVVLGLTTYPSQVPQPIIVVKAKPTLSILPDAMFDGGVPQTQSPNQMWAADVNNDGLPDLVIGNGGLDHPPWTGGPIAVALNLGGGRFRNVSSLVPAATVDRRSYAIAVGDLHGDGRVEILLPDGSQGTGTETLRWNGSGFDADPSWIDNRIWGHPGDMFGASWLGVADFDGDGHSDVLVAGTATNLSLRILHGSTSGFQLWNLRTYPENPWGHTPYLLWNQPGNPSSLGGNMDRVVITDFDGDGRPDLFALAEAATTYQPQAFTDQADPNYQSLHQNGGTNYAQIGLQVLRNEGGRRFTDISADSSATYLGYRYYVASWALDLNGDSAPDVVGLYYTKRYGSQLGSVWGTTFFLNDGTGAFQVVEADVLFPELVVQNQAGEMQLGSLVPTTSLRSGLEGVIVINQADWWSPGNKSLLIESFQTARGIGTGPGLRDAAALGAPGFNEFYYLHAHPDVASLVRAGTYTSGLDHFLKVGRASGYQAFARHTTALGGASPAAVTLYGANTYHCGTAGDTVRVSGGGNVVFSGPGNDSIGGGSGSDEIAYSGPRSRYGVTTGADGSTTVVDSAPGGDGSDVLSGYYRLRFTDAIVEVGPPGHRTVSGPSGGAPVVKR